MTLDIKTYSGLLQYGKAAPDSRKFAIGACRRMRIACAEQISCGRASSSTQVHGLSGQQPPSHYFWCCSLDLTFTPISGACDWHEIRVSNRIQPQPSGINV